MKALVALAKCTTLSSMFHFSVCKVGRITLSHDLWTFLRYGNWVARCPGDMNFCSCYYRHRLWTFPIGRPSTQGWPRTLPGPGAPSSPVLHHGSFCLTCCSYCLQWTAVMCWSNLSEYGHFLTHLPGHQELSLVHSRCSILFLFFLIMSTGGKRCHVSSTNEVQIKV